MKLLTVSLLFITTIYQSSLIAEDICPKLPEDKTIPVSECGVGFEITSVKELVELLKKKEVLLIDVRSKEEFERAHIKGAISIPIGDKPELILKNIAPNCNQKIVVYCENQIDYRSRMVSLSRLGYISLKALGYTNTSQLEELFDPNLVEIAPIDNEKRLEMEGKDLKNSALGKFNLKN